MTIPEILNSVAHRPWKIPTSKWKFYQEWNNAIFLHYEVSLSELEKLVPKELEIDLFEGKPWVSIVAFTMEKIRPKNLPSFSPVSDFDEINIRTYIKVNGKTGVYFLSIEGGKKLSCLVAKNISELPYRYSKIERTNTTYCAQNEEFEDNLHLEFKIGEPLQEKSNLDKWLTERYALFQDTETSINEFEIHHVEWPINEVVLKRAMLHYERFQKLISKPPNKVQYSEGVQVLAWGKVKKAKRDFNV